MRAASVLTGRITTNPRAPANKNLNLGMKKNIELRFLKQVTLQAPWRKTGPRSRLRLLG
jgi:hypothetical protein